MTRQHDRETALTESVLARSRDLSDCSPISRPILHNFPSPSSFHDSTRLLLASSSVRCTLMRCLHTVSDV